MRYCFMTCSYDQMLIRFLRAGFLWVHNVLIGKMSPDVQLQNKNRKNVWYGSGLIYGFGVLKKLNKVK